MELEGFTCIISKSKRLICGCWEKKLEMYETAEDTCGCRIKKVILQLFEASFEANRKKGAKFPIPLGMNAMCRDSVLKQLESDIDN